MRSILGSLTALILKIRSLTELFVVDGVDVISDSCPDIPFSNNFFWLFFFKIQLEVECRFVQDQLKGDNATELRIKFLKKLEDALPVGEE